MYRILFLIHDLGQGGAEKVLVNLVNNMNYNKYDVTVLAIFAGGVNETKLSPKIHYRTIFTHMIPGNSKIMKLFSPQMLHKMFIKDNYDLKISYLEGPSARIISGANHNEVPLCCWIHSNHLSMRELSASFRNVAETVNCYRKFNSIVCVSKEMVKNFSGLIQYKDCHVLYNTVDSDAICNQAEEAAEELEEDQAFKLVAAGSLKKIKGFDRLLRIVERLRKENIDVHLYLLGRGPLEMSFQRFIEEHGLRDSVYLLGYKDNPYKYIARSDLFICSSHSEGFSTAVTEALIVGTPVCTVDVSGMREMLGNSEYGMIVENDEESLYEGICKLINDKELLMHYRNKAKERGRRFSKEATVKAVESFIDELLQEN